MINMSKTSQPDLASAQKCSACSASTPRSNSTCDAASVARQNDARHVQNNVAGQFTLTVGCWKGKDTWPWSFQEEMHISVGSLSSSGVSASKYEKKSGARSMSS